jgi:hypothetical protein
MSVLDMPLSEDLSEAIGQVAINTVIESGLVSVGDAEGRPVPSDYVWVWSANAAEQIGATIRERFDVRFKAT